MGLRRRGGFHTDGVHGVGARDAAFNRRIVTLGSPNHSPPLADWNTNTNPARADPSQTVANLTDHPLGYEDEPVRRLASYEPIPRTARHQKGLSMALTSKITPYSLSWPAQYLKDEPLIASAFNDELIAIHHVGSTAVPG